MSIKSFIYACVVSTLVPLNLFDFKDIHQLEDKTFLMLLMIQYVEEKWNNIRYVGKNTDLK